MLTGELTAINQYFVHAKMCDNWGYRRLGERRDQSIEEMKHAESLVERILYLEGVPNLQRLGPALSGGRFEEQFESDLGVEREALSRLGDGIARASPRATTAAVPLESSSPTRRSTSTGWRRSSRRTARSASSTTWPSSCTRSRFPQAIGCRSAPIPLWKRNRARLKAQPEPCQDEQASRTPATRRQPRSGQQAACVAGVDQGVG